MKSRNTEELCPREQHWFETQIWNSVQSSERGWRRHWVPGSCCWLHRGQAAGPRSPEGRAGVKLAKDLGYLQTPDLGVHIHNQGPRERARHLWEAALFKSYFKIKGLFLRRKGEHVQEQLLRVSGQSMFKARVRSCDSPAFLSTKLFVGSSSTFLGSPRPSTSDPKLLSSGKPDAFLAVPRRVGKQLGTAQAPFSEARCLCGSKTRTTAL